jgi:hypothetical protein
MMIPTFKTASRGSVACIATAMVTLLVLTAPPVARAGTYVVYSCHTPTGAGASTEGWIDVIQTTIPGAGRTTDDCQKAGQVNADGGLEAALREGFADNARAGDNASWSFVAPAGTVIQDASVGLCAVAGAISGSRVSIGSQNSWTTPGMIVIAPAGEVRGSLGCGALPYWRADLQAGGTNYIELGAVNAPRLWFSVWCATEDCNPGHDRYGSIDIAAARFVLRDQLPPTVGRAAGTLASGTAQNGRFEATFDAADSGGGVYRAVAEVKVNQSGDWRPMNSVIVDRLGGRCAPAGVTGDVHEFVHPVPCPASVTDAEITLDTAQLPPGDHLVRAQVEDAAGNRADIVPPRIIHVDEPDRGTALGGVEAVPNNGRGASARALVRLDRTARTVRYRAKVDVKGRLVDENDKPIAGATIQVDWRRLVPRRGVGGAPWRPLGKVITSRTGRFTARISADLSRALRVSYRANLSQDGFTSAAQFALRARAHVTLRATRPRLHNGQTAVFVGRVVRAPRGGVPLSLQAFVPGRGWIPVRTNKPNPRTGKQGRFRMTYRFARTYVRVNYRFRVVVGEDSAFPFVRTVSRRTIVVVGP